MDGEKIGQRAKMGQGFHSEHSGHTKEAKTALQGACGELVKAWKSGLLGTGKHRKLIVAMFKPQVDQMEAAVELLLAALAVEVPEDPEPPKEEDPEEE